MKSALSAAFAAAALLAACTPEGGTPAPQALASHPGASDYAQYCAACHGAGGRGDGPASAGMQPPATDLTLLARRNGGSFPTLQAMARINGHTMGKTDSPMPPIGELLDGPTVPFDAGDGFAEPTSRRLVDVLGYLQSIQR